jgi:hypothetical protein
LSVPLQNRKKIIDFLKKEFITDKYIHVFLVEEATSRTKALQYYENAYNDRNLYEGRYVCNPIIHLL